MLGYNYIGPTLTISGIIRHLSKILAIADQSIPICSRIKPTIENMLKFRANNYSTQTKKSVKAEPDTKNKENKVPISLPQFFQ